MSRNLKSKTTAKPRINWSVSYLAILDTARVFLDKFGHCLPYIAILGRVFVYFCHKFGHRLPYTAILGSQKSHPQNAKNPKIPTDSAPRKKNPHRQNPHRLRKSHRKKSGGKRRVDTEKRSRRRRANFFWGPSRRLSKTPLRLCHIG